jgi:hypothetical protein
MKTETRNDYMTREAVLKLLSPDEVAKVSTAETAKSLPDGEEYLDLEQLERGVLKASGKAPPMGRVLPRKAVEEQTWQKVLTQLTLPIPKDRASRG